MNINPRYRRNRRKIKGAVFYLQRWPRFYLSDGRRYYSKERSA